MISHSLVEIATSAEHQNTLFIERTIGSLVAAVLHFKHLRDEDNRFLSEKIM